MFSKILLRSCFFLIALFVLSCFVSCDNSGDSTSAPDSSADVVTSAPLNTPDTFSTGAGSDIDSIILAADTTSFFPPDKTNDTTLLPTTNPDPVEIVKRSATFGISYYKKMRLNETKIFSVYVSVKNGQAQLKKEIRRTEAEQSINMDENDTTAVITQDINVYERLTVTLEYDTSDFEIKPLHQLATQRIDSVRTTEWKWRVKAISTDQRSSNIIVKVDPEPPIDGVDDILPRNINVKIVFNFWDMVRSWIIYLGNNPQWTLTTLIIPVVIFLFKRRQKNANKKEQERKDEN